MNLNLRKIPIYFLLIIVTISACAYYNTMFNALELYDEGVKKIANTNDGKITPNIKKDFYTTIDKCWTLINLYGDSSTWADDALLLIGKSHYLIEEYPKAERFLGQFLKKYPESDIIIEAQIWYSKVLIELNKDEDALENLNNVLVSGIDSDLKAEAYNSIGTLFYKRNEFQEAIFNLEKCAEISDDDLLSASALYLIGNIYFEQEQYVDAIEKYNIVLEYDPPEEIEFSALMNKVDAQIHINKVDLALKTLNQMLRNVKIKAKYSLVESKMGECFQLQDNIDFAAEHYLDVIEKYPRSLGSAHATFELAKLMEFYYTNADSAQKLYLSVKKESNKSEFVEEAGERAVLLKKYLDLKEKIQNNYKAITEPFIDSLEVDSTSIVMIDSTSFNAQTDSTSAITVDSDSIQSIAKKDKAEQHATRIKKAKSELAKNQYSFAEFFLLNMQNYDSAAAAYSKFIYTGFDSSKIPQAYHALSYIYTYQLHDSLKADSIDNIILEKYSDTPFSDYILIRRGEKKKEEFVEIDTVKNDFLEAERYMFNDEYNRAMNKFLQIIKNDSGSVWAGKARYAISWIYEIKLKDIPKAIESYKLLAKEYPNSEFAKVANNKIKIPKVEVPVDTSKTDSTQVVPKGEEKEEPKLNQVEENPEYEEEQRKKEGKQNKDEEKIIIPEEEDDKNETNLKFPVENYNFPLPQIREYAKKGNTWKRYVV